MEIHAHNIGSLAKIPHNSFGKVIWRVDIWWMSWAREWNLEKNMKYVNWEYEPAQERNTKQDILFLQPSFMHTSSDCPARILLIRCSESAVW